MCCYIYYIILVVYPAIDRYRVCLCVGGIDGEERGQGKRERGGAQFLSHGIKLGGGLNQADARTVVQRLFQRLFL